MRYLREIVQLRHRLIISTRYTWHGAYSCPNESFEISIQHQKHQTIHDNYNYYYYHIRKRFSDTIFSRRNQLYFLNLNQIIPISAYLFNSHRLVRYIVIQQMRYMYNSRFEHHTGEYGNKPILIGWHSLCVCVKLKTTCICGER